MSSWRTLQPGGAIILRQAGVYPLEIYNEERLREFEAADQMTMEEVSRLKRATRRRRQPMDLVLDANILFAAAHNSEGRSQHALEEARRNLRVKHPEAVALLEPHILVTGDRTHFGSLHGWRVAAWRCSRPEMLSRGF